MSEVFLAIWLSCAPAAVSCEPYVEIPMPSMTACNAGAVLQLPRYVPEGGAVRRWLCVMGDQA